MQNSFARENDREEDRPSTSTFGLAVERLHRAAQAREDSGNATLTLDTCSCVFPEMCTLCHVHDSEEEGADDYIQSGQITPPASPAASPPDSPITPNRVASQQLVTAVEHRERLMKLIAKGLPQLGDFKPYNAANRNRANCLAMLVDGATLDEINAIDEIQPGVFEVHERLKARPNGISLVIWQFGKSTLLNEFRATASTIGVTTNLFFVPNLSRTLHIKLAAEGDARERIDIPKQNGDMFVHLWDKIQKLRTILIKKDDYSAGLMTELISLTGITNLDDLTEIVTEIAVADANDSDLLTELQDKYSCTMEHILNCKCLYADYTIQVKLRRSIEWFTSLRRSVMKRMSAIHCLVLGLMRLFFSEYKRIDLIANMFQGDTWQDNWVEHVEFDINEGHAEFEEEVRKIKHYIFPQSVKGAATIGLMTPTEWPVPRTARTILKGLLHILKGRPRESSCVFYSMEHGKGKSTFLKCIMQLVVQSGTISKNDRGAHWHSNLAHITMCGTDDLTNKHWAKYNNERGLLEGEQVVLNPKHKMPYSITAPPSLLTTNDNDFLLVEGIRSHIYLVLYFEELVKVNKKMMGFYLYKEFYQFFKKYYLQMIPKEEVLPDGTHLPVIQGLARDWDVPALACFGTKVQVNDARMKQLFSTWSN